MKFCLSTLLIIAASVYAPFDATSQLRRGWNGIVPLHSSRADVNRMLGTPEGDCQCRYRTKTEIVTFDYAEVPCRGPINGWNVPRDTVLQIRITPISPKTFSELGIDATKYVKTREEDTPTLYFTDLHRGIRYGVQDNHVVTIAHTPLPDDSNLRCPGFPPYDGGITNYHPYDSFPAGSIKQTYAHLDEFAFQLTTQSGLTAYVVAYAGKISRRGDAKKIAGTVRDYLVNKRGIRVDRIFAVDGGFRKKAELELYLVPNGMAAPAPKPTLTPREVTFVSR